MVYVNSNAQWSQYNKILVQPVEFWDDPSTSVSASDQQMLGDYFYNKLKEDLSKDFTLVDQPGPGVLVLRVAIVNATTATPGLRTVSVIVPQARVAKRNPIANDRQLRLRRLRRSRDEGD
jgi:hypothetical protein